MQPAQPSLFPLGRLPLPEVMPPEIPDADMAVAIEVLAGLIAKTVTESNGREIDE